MSKLYRWYSSLSKQIRDSIIISTSLVGMISTVLSIVGVSLGDWKEASLCLRFFVVIVVYGIIYATSYWALGKLFKHQVKLMIRQTPISICCGDIFAASGLRVIGCDTHFDTRIDDIVITKKTLHGQVWENILKKLLLLVRTFASKYSTAWKEPFTDSEFQRGKIQPLEKFIFT